MKIPCPICIPCPDENDSTVLNLSAEAPDVEHFFEFGSTEPWTYNRLCSDCEGQPIFDFCTTSTQEAFGIPMDIWLSICTHNTVTQNPDGGFGPVTPVRLFFSRSVTVTTPCPDGSLFSYTTPVALVVSKMNQENADDMALSFARQIAKQKKCCLADLTPVGCVNQAYSSTTTVVGGSPPYTYDIVAGSVPPGTFPKSTVNNELLIQGVPYLPGTYSFTVRGTDATGSFILRTFSITILAVANTVPNGTVSVPFSYSLVAAGGDAPRTFSLVGGVLPDGLTMSQFGTISGTPVTAESTSFTVKVTDLNGLSCNFDLNMTVNAGVCPNWANTSWAVPFISQFPPNSTATFTPSAANGDTFDAHTTSDGTQTGIAQNVGSFTYNGTGCACKLHVVLTNTNGPDIITISISQGGPTIFSHNFGANPSGTYDFLFNLNNTGGANQVVLVVVHCQSTVGFGTEGRLIGTLSNV